MTVETPSPERPRQIRDRLQALAHDGVGGFLIGCVTAVSMLSFVALIFNGPLAAFQPAGLALIVVSTLVIGLVTAGASSASMPFGLPDGNLVALLGTLTTVTATALAATVPPDQVIGTILAGLAISGLALGLVLMLLARLGAGRIVRFLPLQMTVAFNGTTAWLFCAGGLEVALGDASPLEWISDPVLRWKLAATVLGGLMLTAVAVRRSGRLALPLAILVLIIAHHAGLRLTGLYEGAHESGWLPPVPDDDIKTLPWALPFTGGVDWGALADQSTSLVALVLLGIVTVFVNLIGQEEMEGGDLDMGRELTVAGLSAGLGALSGGFAGFMNSDWGRVLQETGAGTRRGAIIAIVTAAAVPFAAPSLISLVPNTVLGAILLAMGLKMGAEWLVDSNRQLTWLEFPTVGAVVLVTILVGPVEAVLVGLMLGTIGFAIVYARTPPISGRYGGDLAVSHLERRKLDTDFLAARPRSRLVLHLQGYLFFGTAARVEEEVRDALVNNAGVLRFVVLDFSEVDGIDVSAAVTFDKLATYLRRRGAVLVLAAMQGQVYRRLVRADQQTGKLAERFATLDQALEWAEDEILAERGAMSIHDAPSADPLALLLRDRIGCPTRFIPAGTPVIRQGEESTDLLLVVKGRIGITIRHARRPPVRVRAFAAGSMIGEIGFFLGSRRTATVLAEEDCQILVLTRADLDRLAQESPSDGLALYREIERRLCRRILDKDHLVQGLMRARRSGGG